MTATPRILAFDTSGPHCAAAVLIGDRIVASRCEEMGRGQAERLFPMLEEVLGEAGIAWKDLDAIGVGTGPGNFTGIRIAVSAARGLALSLEIPAVGVSLFDALACGASGPLLLVLPAPRDQVYISGRGGVPPDGIELTARDRLPPVPEDTVVIGESAQAVAEQLGVRSAPALHAPAHAIALIAGERWQEPTTRPSPLYVRPADAAPSADPPPVILP